jgi:hypothetical protein
VTGHVGAYGLALPGIPPDTARLLGPAPEDWPAWTLEHRATGHEEWELEKLWPDRARLRLSGGGWTAIDGSKRVAALHMAEPPTHAIAHPYLGLIAAVAAYWRGWDYLHAGAVVVDGTVWGVLGDRGAGKTSTLGFLSRREGVEVLCDDVLVLDRERRGYAGPRFTDLREDAAKHLGMGEPLGVVGARERWRAPLGPVETRLPLTGWVDLSWGPEAAVARPAPGDRFTALARSLALRLVPPDPQGLLALADAPFLAFTRPRGLDQLDRALDLLVDALRQSPATPAAAG